MFAALLGDIVSPAPGSNDRIASLTVLAVCFATFAVLVACIFFAVNSVGVRSHQTANSVIETKTTIPADSTIIWLMSGVTLTPIDYSGAESYGVQFKINGVRTQLIVNKQFFDSLSVGRKIEVDYGYTRLTDEYKPVRIRLDEL